ALLKLVDRPHASVEELVREHIKGPDFPTAGVLLEGEDDIVKMYTKGQGSLTLRSDWEVEPQDDGTARIVITSVPYTVNKATLVEKIAEHIQDKKLPQVVHVRDESTEDVRVVLELKRGAGHDAVMAYLFKHTPLQTRFHVNLTCLVPAEGQEKCAPAKLNLKQILWHFLEFRMDVFTRRTQFDLGALERRIHILEGYELVFNALDEALELIRSADGKRDAQDKLIERFELSEVQSHRVVELPLYRLAKLEIEDIRAELREKRAQAEKLKDLLGNERKRWSAIKRELRSIQSKYADVRRTRVGGNVREFAYSEENYIVDEEYRVLVSKDGWIKRQKSYSDLSTIRVRDHDEVRYAMPGRTRGVVTFFSNMGRAYTMRVDDVPSTSGYGDPVQAFFDFDDGEKVVGVLTDHEDVRRRYDTAQLGDDALALLALGVDSEPSVVQLFAISSAGQSVRFSYSGFDEPSNRKGRIFMRLDDGDAIVNVEPGLGQEYVCLATREGRGLTFVAREISYYKGVAKGVRAVTLVDGDDVLDFTLVRDPQTGLEVETNRGAMHTIQPSLSKFAPSSRGNKGRWVIKRGHLIRAYRPAVEIITVAQEEEERASGERSAGAASEA
ncbi:MAG: DNA gyrase subunit A, partial [Myxococcota bacterium]